MAFFEDFHGTELSSLLSLVDQVRSMMGKTGECDNDTNNIRFPDIVVCGGQSAGKSSVLQALAGVNLPSSSSITTRVALRLSLMVDPTLETGKAHARIGLDQALTLDSAETLPEDRFAELADKVTMLTNQLAGPPPASDEPPNINPEATIYLRVVRRDGPQMTLVDLPGITHYTSQMMKDTKECFRRRFANSNHILLLVLNAVTDPMSSDALSVAREADPGGTRTVCVLTHMDTPFEKSPEFAKTYRQLDGISRLGVFPVLSVNDPTGGPIAARDSEDDYFRQEALVSVFDLFALTA